MFGVKGGAKVIWTSSSVNPYRITVCLRHLTEVAPIPPPAKGHLRRSQFASYFQLYMDFTLIAWCHKSTTSPQKSRHGSPSRDITHSEH